MHHLIAVSIRHVEYRSIGCSKVNEDGYTLPGRPGMEQF
jgi:hypothetical protein